ncbi:MAG: endolytic transglycosylase MltG [Candidatus Promineifilaceae bacterium]
MTLQDKSSPRPSDSAKGCLRLAILLSLIVCVLIAAGTYFAVQQQARMRAAGIRLADASPDLNLARQLALQYSLAQNVAALDQAAGNVGTVAFTIAPGATADKVAGDLADLGILRDKELFLDYLRFYGLDARLQAGQYTLDGRHSLRELVDAITEGTGRDVTVSFLQGMRIEEMADSLAMSSPAAIDAAEFLALARRDKRMDLSPYPFLNSLDGNSTLEGFLFPGTYDIPADADAHYLINAMLRNFDRQVSPAMRQAFGAQNLSLLEAVTLASIVARETPYDEERPRIASVYLNRLRRGMPLQADPTVQYAAGFYEANQNWWKVPLSIEDLRKEHPYNTYVIPALPPGPIANPGLTSLQAVAEPEDTDYLFFVLDCASNPPGRHVFSHTFEEHLANVERCR